MKKYFLPALTGAALLCGCDKQTKINGEKIQILSQKIVQLEQTQSNQMATIQSQLASLGPMLDKMNDFYFEKSHDEAFFFHTNTLYLLLTVGKKIESELQAADTERAAQNSLAFYYHTNQMGMTFLAAAQVVDNVNAETKRAGEALSDALLKEIKLSAPDPAEAARLKEMESDVAQIKRGLDQIKIQLNITNPPAARP